MQDLNIGELLSMDPTICRSCGCRCEEFLCAKCDEEAKQREKAHKQQKAIEKEQARRAKFGALIPEGYRDTDRARLPEWSQKLIRAWKSNDRHGVTIQGPAGNFKTRTACVLAQKAYFAGKTIEFRQAGDLRRTVTRESRDGDDLKLLRDLIKIDVLVIDDLGNHPWRESSEEFFLTLLERRNTSKRPTIITTQFPGTEFVDRFTSRRSGMALARRIGPEFNFTAYTADETVNHPTP